ncbi:ParB family protein [Vibrio campbellii]
MILVQLDSKGIFAYKLVKRRNFSDKFGRLSKEIQD